jgi:serine/threonine protein kinase
VDGSHLGRPLYLSPEQARGTATSPRSDLYSRGVVLYEALAGSPPSTGEGPVEIAMRHVTDEPPALLTKREIPSELVDVVMTALAKRPSERYASAGAMRAALEEARETAERTRRLEPVASQTAATRALGGGSARAGRYRRLTLAAAIPI